MVHLFEKKSRYDRAASSKPSNHGIVDVLHYSIFGKSGRISNMQSIKSYIARTKKVMSEKEHSVE